MLHVAHVGEEIVPGFVLGGEISIQHARQGAGKFNRQIQRLRPDHMAAIATTLP